MVSHFILILKLLGYKFWAVASWSLRSLLHGDTFARGSLLHESKEKNKTNIRKTHRPMVRGNSDSKKVIKQK